MESYLDPCNKSLITRAATEFIIQTGRRSERGIINNYTRKKPYKFELFQESWDA